MSTVNDIRQAFLDFFAARDHRVVPSSPLVPLNDPTLMFTNAGMVPFKNVFTGAETRDYARAATAQKCVRAGGKHNDLDNVGYTARHHTFFEMLGNFSFGDYFKEEAILYAWELITKDFGVSPDRLIATVFHEDDAAYDLWKKISGLPEDRVLRIATSDNFWAMGETGPCGPCSEIFYDHGEALEGGPPGSEDEEGERFVEIWNLVFMQYEQVTPEKRIELPKPSIDTGMGLERIAAVLQGTHDNYETDLFRALIAESEEVTGVKAEGKHKASHRVIADHLRASSFLIADGVLPSNEGRGYVLRRIMRRAMRHGALLGYDDLLLYRLVPALIGEMGAAYPELGRAQALITETLKLEEERFHKTLERGLKLLADEVAKLGKGAALPGEVAFKLYDTYGFPLDMTEDALRAEGRAVDTKGFEAAMARQREEARKAWAGSGDSATETLWFDIHDKVGATDFLGYQGTEADGQITAIVKDGKSVKSAKMGEKVSVILNQTPFYGESGGQIGDIGTLSTEAGGVAVVTDTVKPVDDLHVHKANITEGTLTVGDAVHAVVDAERRRGLMAHHSVTHVLHEALRRVLGTHVTQKGSLVAPDRLRFDFSHPKAVTPEELNAISDMVNARILSNEPVETRLMTPDEATAAGALALFGEKYGDEVRVVSMGRDAGSGTGHYSVELCGGTHVSRLGDIGLFHITSEGAVASGVRRIEAVAGRAAREYLLAEETRLRKAAAAAKTSPEELANRLRGLLDENRALKAELESLKKQVALGGGPAKEEPKAQSIAGISYLGQRTDGMSAKELRGLADEAKKSIGSGVVAFVSVVDGKAGIVVGVTDDLTDRLDAVELIKAGYEPLGGQKGGGRPDFAQAGGPNVAGADAALVAVAQALEKQASGS